MSTPGQQIVEFDPRDAIAALQALPADLRWALERARGRLAEEAARDMRRELRARDAMAFSTLVNSVRADRVDDDEHRVGPHVQHAAYVFFGRRPGGRRPPMQPILDWVRVRRLGGAGNPARLAWAIARSIQRRGIRGRDYLTPVRERMQPRARELAVAAVNDAARGNA